MAAPGPWVLYDQFKLNLGKKIFDLTADTFKVALVSSTSNAMSSSLATPDLGGGITNELATANGYTAGGVSVGVGAYTNSAGTETFDVADATWTASGAGITARAAVLYDSTDASKRAIAYCLLDSTPADVVVAAGNTLTINIANVFTGS